MPKYRTWIEISERALVHNIEQLQNLVGDATFCAIVKANAYGHGLKEVVQIAGRAGVDCFGVDDVDDALYLRSLFPSAMLIVLGYTMSDRFEEVVKNKIELTLYDEEGITALETVASRLATQASVHLKIETGTSRQGVHADDLDAMIRRLLGCTHLKLNGVATHFANIEDATNTQYATLQFERFQAAVKKIREHHLHPQWIHCACSAAIILYPDTHGTLVRAGISMYGIWPSSLVEQTISNQKLPTKLESVLQWKTRIAQVKTLSGGTPIGYGLTHILKQRSRIAVIPVGYWDGYDRLLSSKGEVLIGGYRCPVVGRICMNMMMVNVSDVPRVEKGQEVILIGRDGRHEITAESVAQSAQTIGYEIVARINPNLPRIVT